MAKRPATIQNQWEGDLSAVPARVVLGDRVTLTVTVTNQTFQDLPDDAQDAIYDRCFSYTFTSNSPPLESLLTSSRVQTFTVPTLADNLYDITVTVTPLQDLDQILDAISQETGAAGINALPRSIAPFSDSATIRVADVIRTQSNVTLQRTFAAPTDDMAMGPAIRNRTSAVGFDRYSAFINCIFCEEDRAGLLPDISIPRRLPCVDEGVDLRLNIHGPYAYSLLKLATQVFLTLESGVVIRDDRSGNRPIIFDIEKERARFYDQTLNIDTLNERLTRYLLQPDGQASALPYLKRIVTALISLARNPTDEVLPYCHGILQYRFTEPSLIELIWSYWHEEGMLVQTMNAIARRFQNERGSPHDPLGELEFDPLRPLNNLIWGFIQDEHNRLTVPRRAYEYQHHYGLPLVGKAVERLTPADIRSKFIEGFHNLLYRAAIFYREDADTTVVADAFPLLNALKEVHLLLAEGAHNQFGDLTWTARAEMLMMQWMLARPEMREFLRGRYMVPYQEPWMGAVDSMKKLQGWTDTSVTHFHELAVTGERILLSIRYGDWVDIDNIEDQAKNWARSWKPEIQRYLHGYLTVSGIDLMADVTDSRDAALRYLPPSVLLQRRLVQQQAATQLPTARETAALTARVSGYARLPARNQARLVGYKKPV